MVLLQVVLSLRLHHVLRTGASQGLGISIIQKSHHSYLD
ncbi:hypothetical protein CAter282_2198 [Collimonas arenae]|uniref:Uncharacterized protein n=1 Tax=Collimonas arenae TaxID=279058 RepID=A0A127PQH1_9BURK|nr:hypothetical protein CAter10_2397 [Collimonas arenae]AMP09952.1 hypothetical protein CAter282_2198 [Collimonas arenae]